MTSFVIFYPYHFVRTILSMPFCPILFCLYTILSIPFCPYHFVRYHFVLEPLALVEQTETGMQNRFDDWQRTLERKGLKVNINKTETMVCSKVPETVTIKDAIGNTLKLTETFKYLGSTFSAQSGCEHDVRNRIKIAWQKWRELTCVLCDNKMPI